MLGHGAKFGRKKEQAIAALLTHSNVEAAARAVEISPNTLRRWMKDPEFDAAYRVARRTAFSQSIARLQQASSAAVTTLLRTMTDPNASSSTRARVAEVVLERTAKAIEIEDTDVRLAELERAVSSAHRPHQPSAILTWPNNQLYPAPPTPASADEPAVSPSSRISVPEIARRMNIGRMAVYAMLEQGIIPGVRRGRRWIITRNAYLAWERTCGLRTALDFGARQR